MEIRPAVVAIKKIATRCPVGNTDTKLLIYGLFQMGRVLAQHGATFPIGSKSRCVLYQCTHSRVGELEVLRTTPRPASTDHLGLVEATSTLPQTKPTTGRHGFAQLVTDEAVRAALGPDVDSRDL